LLYHFIVFCILLPHPRSTLFPYTTLFRSFCSARTAGLAAGAGWRRIGRLGGAGGRAAETGAHVALEFLPQLHVALGELVHHRPRSEEHTSELQSRENLVCRLLLEKKKCMI